MRARAHAHTPWTSLICLESHLFRLAYSPSHEASKGLKFLHSGGGLGGSHMDGRERDWGTCLGLHLQRALCAHTKGWGA